MAKIKRMGFGQVEPNHLSAQGNRQIYAQLPADPAIKVLENGQFAKYNYADNKVDFEGEGEWMLVFNEVKLYGDGKESYKDFALQTKNYTEGIMTPRLFKTQIGDIYTTNCIEVANTAGTVEVETTADYSIGDELSPNAKGYLAKDGDGSIVFQIVKIYTMPDGQPAVKLMRIR